MARVTGGGADREPASPEFYQSVGFAKITPDPHRRSAAKGLHAVLGGSLLETGN